MAPRGLVFPVEAVGPWRCRQVEAEAPSTQASRARCASYQNYDSRMLYVVAAPAYGNARIVVASSLLVTWVIRSFACLRNHAKLLVVTRSRGGGDAFRVSLAAEAALGGACRAPRRRLESPPELAAPRSSAAPKTGDSAGYDPLGHLAYHLHCGGAAWRCHEARRDMVRERPSLPKGSAHDCRRLL